MDAGCGWRAKNHRRATDISGRPEDDRRYRSYNPQQMK
jgi:hypothetical protein